MKLLPIALMILCSVSPTLVLYGFAGAMLYRDGADAYRTGWLAMLGFGTALLFRGPLSIEIAHPDATEGGE